MSEIIQVQDSRRIFIDTLIKLAEKDDKIVLIVPDVGFNYIEEFQKRFPNRFFNFGVTEQSIVMIAVGMAISGYKPWVYSMINFVAFRPFEMIRNGIACHKADVKLLGVKGSEKYKFLGFSHNMLEKPVFDYYLEDVYHLAPYITCYDSSVMGVAKVVEEAYQSNQPAYIRL